MNLTKLFEAQRTLDERIIEEKGLQGQNLIPKKVLALITELGECANEWRGFKFWSEDQAARTKSYTFEDYEGRQYTEHFDPRVEKDYGRLLEYAGGDVTEGNPLLEEYVDCLHFALSLVLDTHIHIPLPKRILAESEHHPTVEHGFIYATQAASDVAVGSVKDQSVAAYVALQVVLDLGMSLGFTDEQIESAYFAKNATNHKRQEEHY